MGLGVWWEREPTRRVTEVNIQLQPGITAVRENTGAEFMMGGGEEPGLPKGVPGGSP